MCVYDGSSISLFFPFHSAVNGISKDGGSCIYALLLVCQDVKLDAGFAALLQFAIRYGPLYSDIKCTKN